MEEPRRTLKTLLPLCLLLALAVATVARAQGTAVPPTASPDAAFLQTLDLGIEAAASLPAPADFLPTLPAATCTCTQEMNDCRTLCTGNGCRPAFVCNTSNPCLSTCRCTHCV